MNAMKKCRLPKIVMAGLFLILVFLNAGYLENWIDSDMAAEMIFSRLLAKEGQLFASQNWFYSTEFRVLYTQLLMAPLFRVFSDWHVIRMITNVIFYILLLYSYFYLCKPFHLEEDKKLWCGCGLLLPFSETMMLHMYMGNTYISHVIICFFIVGMFCRLSIGWESGWRRKVTFLCFIALSVICGISGVRYMLALQCPLLLAALGYILQEETFHELRMAPNRDTRKALWQGQGGSYLRTALTGMVCAVLGYGINVAYVSRTYSFQTYESTSFIDVYQGTLLQRIQDAFGSILMLFGYIPGKSVLSLRGIVTMIAFVLIALILFLVIRAWRTKRSLHRFLLFFLAASFFLNSFVFLFTNSTLVPRYYITTLIFILPIAAIYFTEETIAFDKRAVAVLLGLCLLIATGKTTVSMMTTDKNQEKRKVAAFLVEQGYDFGYATYWNGNILQELSNGKLQVANIRNPEQFTFFQWSSECAYYEKDYTKGRVFLVLTQEEYDACQDVEVLEAGKEIYHQDGFVIYGYESNQILLEQISQEMEDS